MAGKLLEGCKGDRGEQVHAPDGSIVSEKDRVSKKENIPNIMKTNNKNLYNGNQK